MIILIIFSYLIYSFRGEIKMSSTENGTFLSFESVLGRFQSVLFSLSSQRDQDQILANDSEVPAIKINNTLKIIIIYT